MNDFSFSAVFRAAFNTLIKNFTDVLFISVLSAALILFVSLFSNLLFIGSINASMTAAISENFAQSAKVINPFVLFSICMAFVIMFTAMILFFMASAFLPLCKGKIMKLKDYVPSFLSVLRFMLSAAAIFFVFAFIIAAMPFIAKSVSGGDGYTAGMFAVSALSFALIAVFVIFTLQYILYFLPLLENAGLKEAFQKSKEITNDRKMKIFVLLAVLFIINYIGKFFIVLLLLTVPFSILAVIYAYFELCGGNCE
ncbi:MAG: hypothetical protein FWH43_06825 [Endomicrobia bacterium]|nr:hypothetical protein [Endomicrobiia bacterium]